MTPHADLVAAVRAYRNAVESDESCGACGWHPFDGHHKDCELLQLDAVLAALPSAEAARGEEYTSAAVAVAESIYANPRSLAFDEMLRFIKARAAKEGV